MAACAWMHQPVDEATSDALAGAASGDTVPSLGLRWGPADGGELAPTHGGATYDNAQQVKWQLNHLPGGVCVSVSGVGLSPRKVNASSSFQLRAGPSAQRSTCMHASMRTYPTAQHTAMTDRRAP